MKKKSSRELHRLTRISFCVIRVICGKFLRTLTLSGLVLILAAAPGARAERKYLFGFSSDILTGVTNQAATGNSNLSPVTGGYFPFYSTYPSLSLKSIGRRSTLDLNYTFTVDRYETDDAITTMGHALRSVFVSELGKRTRLRLNGEFNTTPQLSLINVLTGFTLNPQGGFGYIYDPQTFENAYQRASGGAELELDLTRSSFLTFAGSGAYVHYGSSVSTAAYLSNQIRAEGSLAYSYRRGRRQTWGVKYSAYQNDFDRYGKVRSQSAMLTFARELSPSLRLTLDAGPSYTEKSSSRPEYLGYNASINISKTIHTNLITLNGSHRTGDSTGLGGATDSTQVGLSYSHTFGRNTTLRVDASAFDQKQHSSSAYRYRGISGSLALLRMIGRHWQIGVGASYQDYPSASGVYPTGGYPGRVYKRLYLSMGYRMPELWRASK